MDLENGAVDTGMRSGGRSGEPSSAGALASADVVASPRIGEVSPIPILTYHNVGAAPPDAAFRGLYVSPGQFRRQMRSLRVLGYRGLSMRDGLPYLRGERHGRVALLTFDDGYQDNLDAALPVLKDVGFTATCYLVSDCIGGYNRWDAAELGVRKPLMDRGGVRAWLAAGMDIGSHTRSHPRLTTLGAAARQSEISDSRTELEQAFGVPVDHFCYPYGDVDAACAREAAASGYLTATTTARGRARPGDAAHALPRVGISGQRNWVQFLAKVTTGYEDRRRRGGA